MNTKTVFWIAAILSLLLFAWIILCRIREGKKSSGKTPLWERFFLPAGQEVLRLLAGRQKPGKGVYPIFIRMMGKTEGKKQYEIFQSRRISTLLVFSLAFLVLVMIGTASAAFSDKKEIDLKRDPYGQAARVEKAMLTIADDQGSLSKKITIRIPSRDMTQEEAGLLLEEAEEQLMKTVDGTLIRDKITLPGGVGQVTVKYLSLSPDLIRSDGLLLKEPGEEQRELFLRATLEAGGYTRKVLLRLSQICLADLSEEERLDLLAKQIEDGRFLDHDQMNLPERTMTGEAVSLSPAFDPHPEKVFLILLLLPVLWVYQEQEARKLWKERDEKMMLKFPEFVGELMILSRAGLSLPLCLIRIGRDYRKQREKGEKIDVLYEEIARIGEEITEGISFREAVRQMRERTAVPRIRQLCHILIQNERRSNVYLLDRLTELSEEAWEGRKQRVRELSETADTRLVFPLVLMMAVVLMVVLAPSLITLK
ncbi:MAG: type II secretion system F family protein [Firmicutes bacterium]|nr:type II secretion system F family protein [Bacillota bacterium]